MFGRLWNGFENLKSNCPKRNNPNLPQSMANQRWQKAHPETISLHLQLNFEHICAENPRKQHLRTHYIYAMIYLKTVNLNQPHPTVQTRLPCIKFSSPCSSPSPAIILINRGRRVKKNVIGRSRALGLVLSKFAQSYEFPGLLDAIFNGFAVLINNKITLLWPINAIDVYFL